MKDEDRHIWREMYKMAKRDIEGNCPSSFDPTCVAVYEEMQRLELELAKKVFHIDIIESRLAILAGSKAPNT